mgnify:CR=1 FL=1
MKKDTGARALRAIIEDFMLDIMYEIPKDDSIGQVTITESYIEGTGGPVITSGDRLPCGWRARKTEGRPGKSWD